MAERQEIKQRDKFYSAFNEGNNANGYEDLRLK
jgi:hypothetical protein